MDGVAASVYAGAADGEAAAHRLAAKYRLVADPEGIAYPSSSIQNVASNATTSPVVARVMLDAMCPRIAAPAARSSFVHSSLEL